MTLIDTDGMSFIGPGSEWFWTAISGVVLVASPEAASVSPPATPAAAQG